MSQNNDKNNNTSNHKTPTSIKIAAKEASQRASSGQGTADPGPGDPSAAPSVAPQLVEIPDPPTPSQLIVKSTKTVDQNAGPAAKSSAASAAAGATGASGATRTEAGGLSAGTAVTSGASGVGAGAGATTTAKTEPTGSAGVGQQQSPVAVSSPAAESPEKEQTPSERVKTFSKYTAAQPKFELTGSPASGPSSAGTKGAKTPTSPHQHHEAGKKKTTQRFRYHKRVTVRTKGKTSPNAIMDKVNYKDHKAGITPSAIEDMDPQELMKRAGIKDTKKGTHWRVRLRQTEKVTKGGKTVTQTKVAYRDSEGNKKIKTSKTPNCEKCGKRLEECECDSTSNQ